MMDTDMYITGFGTIVPGADNNDKLWENIKNRKKHFVHRKMSDDAKILVAEEPEYDLSMYDIPKKNFKRMDIQMVYSLMSAINCVKDSGLDFNDEFVKKHTGVIAGSFFAQIAFGLEQVKKVEVTRTTKISPYTGMAFYYGSNAGEISLLFNTQGENCAVISGSNIGIDAVGIAYEMFADKRNEIVLICGSENMVYDIMYYSLKNINSIASDKYLPFSDNEDGAAFANGSMSFSVETKNSVMSRNAVPLSVIKSYDTVYCPSYFFNHNDTIIDYYVRTIKQCMEKLCLNIDDIDMVIPTASGIKDDDTYEKEAIKKLFGIRENIVYTPKPVVGNGLSYNVILDFFIASKCIKESFIPAMPEENVTGDHVFDKMMVFDPIHKEINNVLIIHKSFTDGKISTVIIGKCDLYEGN